MYYSSQPTKSYTKDNEALKLSKEFAFPSNYSKFETRKHIKIHPYQ